MATVFFKTGDDISTDVIYPGRYMATVLPTETPQFAFADNAEVNGKLKAKQVAPGSVIVAGKNFGCGSSREHAPLAIAEAGAKVVVAEFYARIFFRNCVNGGYLPPCESTQRLVDDIRTGDEVTVDIEAGTLTNHRDGRTYRLKPLGEVKPIIEAGGVFEYARRSGMLAR